MYTQLRTLYGHYALRSILNGRLGTEATRGKCASKSGLVILFLQLRNKPCMVAKV